MRTQAGAPVTGADFFNRDAELRLLEAKVRNGTHVLLAGQRRMGKTSVAKELGRHLQTDGWEFLFVDVEPPHRQTSSGTSPKRPTALAAFRRA